jgi:hypothetical protein
MIKNHVLILVFAVAVVLSACDRHGSFKSDVTTEKKPWTNLNFNNAPENFQFAIISDRNGGSRPGIFEDGIKKLNLMQPEFVINIGDLLPGYTTDTAKIRRDWDEVNGLISTLKMPFFYIPGNHDITNETMGKEWEKRFGCRYYNFEFQNTLFIVMDSNDDHDFNLSRKQTDFVLKTIKNHQNVRWTYLFVHHPIWKYNTDGRFGEIEEALSGRKFTVFAGHEHQYNQSVRKGANFYILSTTGGGSSLRGNYFGEFDHISWVTATDQGPVIANLRLDGILPHDISNNQTMVLANPLSENAGLNGVLLCNKGNEFKNGTYYLSFNNPTSVNLKIHINFFYHNLLRIDKPIIDLLVAPGTSNVVEIPVNSNHPLSYGAIDPIRFDWEMQYDHPDYPGFALQGKGMVEVKPTKTAYINKEINTFIENDTIKFNHPFSNLESIVKQNNSAEEKYSASIIITENTKLSFYLKNRRNECSLPESLAFYKTDYQEPTEVKEPKAGLNFSYYEGNWSSMPDFGKIKALENGVANNLMVQDHARRKSNWAMVYSGYIRILTDKLYSFNINAGDGCRLFVNDKIVVDENTIVKGEKVGAVALRKGFHKIRVEFLEKKGRAKLRFYIKTPEEEDWKSIDPASLYH